MNPGLKQLSAAFALCAMLVGGAARAQNAEPDHVRGQIASVEAGAVTLKTADGKTVRLTMAEKLPVFSLSKASFSGVDFGVYVGSAAVRLDMTSPIVRATPRETISWLYEGFELRIIDEALRGIAVGFKKWDKPGGASMTHGWVDDLEGRVVSIKYGPTQDEESDVIFSKDVPVTRMSIGDMSMLKPGVHVVAGSQKGADGKPSALFLFVGLDGLVPSL
jgi:hypothetical protein